MVINRRAKLVLRTMGRKKYNRCMKVLEKMKDKRSRIEWKIDYAKKYLQEQKDDLSAIQKKISSYEIEMARTIIHENGKQYNQ